MTLVPLVNNFVNVQLHLETPWIKTINLLLFVKAYTLNSVFNTMEAQFQLSPTVMTFYRFLKVIGRVFFFAHIIGCLWYVIGTLETNSWIVIFIIINISDFKATSV